MLCNAINEMQELERHLSKSNLLPLATERNVSSTTTVPSIVSSTHIRSQAMPHKDKPRQIHIPSLHRPDRILNSLIHRRRSPRRNEVILRPNKQRNPVTKHLANPITHFQRQSDMRKNRDEKGDQRTPQTVVRCEESRSRR